MSRNAELWSYRVHTRFVPLGSTFRPLGNPGMLAARSAVATLDRIDVPSDPSVSFVPSARPTPLEPIDGMDVATGVALPWLRWATIRSPRQPRFMERFAPGAFTETLRPENRQTDVIALSDHGQGPYGLMPLGRMQTWEAADGLRFELAFLPVDYARNIAAGVKYGLYGASIRFATATERANLRPGRSLRNPDGLEERTITRAELIEISIVARPAYGGTTVNLAA